jgi:hypothetical protein
MTDQKLMPVYSDDHNCFKQIAAKRGISMKELFHELIKEYPTWPVTGKANGK